MAKSLISALVVAVTIGPASAAERPYLFPIDEGLSVFSVAPGHQAYKLATRDALIGTAGDRTWEAVVFPSFQREWAVYVEKARPRGTYQVVCTRMQTQLWGQVESVAERETQMPYAERQLAALLEADKRIRRSASPISASTVATLDGLWSAMISQAQIPTEPPRCLDGTSYFLFELTEGIRGRGGWGRCPQQGTPPAAGLVVLTELCGVANSEPTKLTQAIATLQRSLK